MQDAMREMRAHEITPASQPETDAEMDARCKARWDAEREDRARLWAEVGERLKQAGYPHLGPGR